MMHLHAHCWNPSETANRCAFPYTVKFDCVGSHIYVCITEKAQVVLL